MKILSGLLDPHKLVITKPNFTKLLIAKTCKDRLGRKTDKLLLTGGQTGAYSAVSLAQR